MDVREKLVELIAQKVCDTWSEDCDEWMPHDCGKCYANDCHISELADHLIANGVTVQGSKVVEIGQFKLPIADAILILKEEYKQRVDGYTTHLSYGGNGDPAEEVSLDALAMAISALEKTKWISVDEKLPQNFVSVLGYMTDAGEFPPVRECYTVGNVFFFPALGDIHPVSYWCEIPHPPKGE